MRFGQASQAGGQVQNRDTSFGKDELLRHLRHCGDQGVLSAVPMARPVPSHIDGL